jgi:hypothetical protein
MTEQPNARTDEELRDEQADAAEEETTEEEVGVVPEGAVSDTTAVKEAGSIGRPASTMRA